MRIGWLLPLVAIAAFGCGGDCPDNQRSCGGTCVDPLSSNAHCGTCDNACSGGLVCGNGTCGDRCPLGQAECDGTCVDTQTDAANCGSCGEACAAGDQCTEGVCHAPCDPTMLSASVEDPVGNVWDGLERTAAPLDVAAATCAAFGAELPSATALYRASAPQQGGIGMSFHTNFLWSRAPNDRLSQATVRLSDGATSSAAAATAQAYRCVCPAIKPRYFTGKHCHGPAGCFAYANYNIDSGDRPALRKSAALWECVNERAHLADVPLLAAAIRGGLPSSGTNAFIATADAHRYEMSTAIRWTNSTWELTGNISAFVLSTPAPFRCAGPKFAASFNATPVTGAGEFLPRLSTYKSEDVDRASSAWAAAHDFCWMRGGHLPRATELAELIGQGLPGGTNAYLRTADQTGYNTVQFLSEIMRWSGIDQRFPYDYAGGAGDVTWGYKTDAYPFRCIYYPLDPAFVAPTSCNGGCSVRSAGSPAATIWFDLMDRAAATYAAAAATCAETGGYLASERDYTEAIRDGLPNGSGTYLLTSDVAGGSDAVGARADNHTVVLWSGVNRGFTDIWDGTGTAPMTWSGIAAARPYRCMWTNEVR